MKSTNLQVGDLIIAKARLIGKGEVAIIVDKTHCADEEILSLKWARHDLQEGVNATVIKEYILEGIFEHISV